MSVLATADAEIVRGLQERVERGAALLDKRRRSPAWRKKVNPDKLRIEHADVCILGQLYGDYAHGLGKVGIHEDDVEKSASLGFTLADNHPGDERWGYLNELWKLALSA